MSYLKANLFWKNLMKSAVTGTRTFRRSERGATVNKREMGEKSLSLRFIGLLMAIIAAAILLSLLGAWWFEA